VRHGVDASLDATSSTPAGYNAAGQIFPNGSTPKFGTPRAALREDVRAVVAGDAATCVLKQDETVRCWGAWGNVSKDFPSLSPAEEIAVGHYGGHVCVRGADGKVLCVRTLHHDAEMVPGVDDAKKIRDSCALTSTGRVVCWHWPAVSGPVSAAIRPIFRRGSRRGRQRGGTTGKSGSVVGPA